MIDRFDFIAVSLSILAGVIIVISRTLNARLAELTSVRISTFFNYFVGLSVAIIVFLILGKNEPVYSNLVLSPNVLIYFGGTVGVCLVLTSNIVVTKVSAFYLALLLFIGQVFTGIIIDAAISRSFSKSILIGGILVAAGFCLDIILSRNTTNRKDQKV
jgi:transporter family-2 protein